MVQASGGPSSSLNQIEYNLRVTADAAGAVQASQAFQQVEKQADRTANSLVRAFGPRVIGQMTQVQSKLVEQGQALVGFGKSLEAPSKGMAHLSTQLEGTGKGLTAMGVAQTKAGQTGQVNAKVMRVQAVEMQRASQYLKTLATQEQQRIQNLQQSTVSAQAYGKAGEQVAVALAKSTAAAQDNVRVLTLQSASLKSAAANQDTFSQETMRAAASQGSFTGEATLAQRAGQGLILSFSAAQMAAGNFQQGLFGLGFSLMFVGKSIVYTYEVQRAWTAFMATRSVAAVGALSSALMTTPLAFMAIASAITMLAIPAIKGWIKGGEDAETITERLTRRTEELEEAVGRVKGPYEELAEVQARMVEQGEPVFAALVQQLDEVRAPAEATQEVLEATGLTIEQLAGVEDEWIERMRTSIATSGEFKGEIAGLTVNVVGFSREITAAGISMWSFEQAQRDAKETVKDTTTWIKDQRMAIQEQLLVNMQQQVAIRAEIEANIAREASIKRITGFYDNLAESVREGVDALIEQRRAGATEEVEAVRAGLEAETQARQDALQDWVTDRRAALQESINIINEERDAAIKAAQQASAGRIDTLEDERDATVKAVRDASAERIEIIEKERDATIEASREKVEELRTLERELANEIRDLEGQRRQALQDIMVTEAEIAEIEAILRQMGPDPALEAELRLRQARLAALEKSQEAMKDEIDVREDTMSTIDEQIESEEDRQKAVRETAQDAIDAERDAASERIAEIRKLAQDAIAAERTSTQERIDEIRDLAQERSNAARTAADAEITQMQRSTRDQLNVLRAGVNDQIAEINRRRDANIEAIEAGRDAQIDFINETRDARLDVIDISSEQRKLNALIREAVDLRAREAFIMSATVQQMEYIGNMREWAKVQIGRGVSPEVITQQLRAVAEALGIPENILRILLAELGLPQFQHGGVVPGPLGQPRLIVAHGGETVSNRAAGAVTSISVIFQIENFSAGSNADLTKMERRMSRALGGKVSLGVRSRRLL